VAVFGLTLGLAFPFSCRPYPPRANTGGHGHTHPPSGSDMCEAPEPAPVCPWQPYTGGLEIGGHIETVAFDPTTPGRAFAVSGKVVHVSEDDGNTFSSQAPGTEPIRSLAFTPVADVFFAATSRGVVKTDDAGASFQPVGLSGLSVRALMVHPEAEQRLYASVDGAGILSSADGGQSWRATNAGVPYGEVYALLPMPGGPGDVLAGFRHLGGASGSPEGGVLRRSGDASWHTVFEDRLAVALDRCPADDQVIWAVQYPGGLARSTDGGQSFTYVPVSQHPRQVAVRGEDCQRVYAAAFQQGFFRSLDGGTTWEGPLNEGVSLKTFSTHAMSVSTDGQDTILLATAAGVFRSENRGDSWDSVGAIGEPTVRALAGGPDGGGPLWMQTWGVGLWRNTGAGWDRVTSFPADYGNVVAVSPHDPLHLFAGEYLSTDGGTSWTRPQGLTNTMGVAFHSDDPDTLFIASQVLGFVRSYDRGQTIEVANGDLSPWVTEAGVFVDVRGVAHLDGRTYIATYGRGVFVSDDEGETWTATAPALAQSKLVLLVDNGSELLAISEAGDVHLKDGDGWRAHRAGLPSLLVSGAVWNALQGRWYLATSAGIYSSDGEDDWSSIAGACEAPVSAMALVQDGDQALVAATAGTVVEIPLP
ncbi:MAG: hypothetical protein OXR73_31715, partial [Myxococcales bacterium]|nr:hypothetical protein [Myxococcales bacterium]